jgi:predicted pyridoxine 5'-phosphate oxidase superfamily flavin-nucleotide-binding protein
MDWKEKFKEEKELVLATSSRDGTPNANIAISQGFVDDKLLIADCQMERTIRNLNENKKIAVIGGYYRASGTVEIFASGKYFNMCVEKSKGYKVKNAILVDVKEVFDLDNKKIVFSKALRQI